MLPPAAGDGPATSHPLSRPAPRLLATRNSALTMWAFFWISVACAVAAVLYMCALAELRCCWTLPLAVPCTEAARALLLPMLDMLSDQ